MLLPSAPEPFATVTREQSPKREVWTTTDLKRCLVQPAKFWLRQLGVRPESPEVERWEESGEIGGLPSYRAVQRCLELIDLGIDDPKVLADQLVREGGLPAGALGREKAAGLVAQALGLAELRRQHVGTRVLAASAPFEFECAGLRVIGTAHGRYGDRLIRLHPGRLHARNCFQGWLDGLALAVAGVPVSDLVVIGLEEREVAWKRIPLADAATHLANLLEIAGHASREPLPLFPVSGLAYVEARLGGSDERGAMQKAWRCWHGGFNSRGEGADAELALYARDWVDPLAAPFADLARCVHEPWFERAEAGA
jgi:exonuclease V gamma subunit